MDSEAVAPSSAFAEHVGVAEINPEAGSETGSEMELDAEPMQVLGLM